MYNSGHLQRSESRLELHLSHVLDTQRKGVPRITYCVPCILQSFKQWWVIPILGSWSRYLHLRQPHWVRDHRSELCPHERRLQKQLKTIHSWMVSNLWYNLWNLWRDWNWHCNLLSREPQRIILPCSPFWPVIAEQRRVHWCHVL